MIQLSPLRGETFYATIGGILTQRVTKIEHILNTLGTEGWDVVGFGTEGMVVILKRPKQ